MTQNIQVVPFTTHNVLWLEVESERVNVATHYLYFNDLQLATLPSNVLHLIYVLVDAFSMKDYPAIDSKNLPFFVYSFAEKEVALVTIPSSNTSEIFVFDLTHDELYHNVYVKDINARSCAFNPFPSQMNSTSKLWGSYVTPINND